MYTYLNLVKYYEITDIWLFSSTKIIMTQLNIISEQIDVELT